MFEESKHSNKTNLKHENNPI